MTCQRLVRATSKGKGMFELGFVDLRGRLRSKTYQTPRDECTFSETILMHRSDGTAATSGDWGDRTHPNVRARVGATYKTPRSVFGFASLLTREGEPHQLCVRSLLAKTEARIESLAPGVSVGYELEFFCDEEAAPAGLSPHADFDLYGARLSGGGGFRLLDFLIAQGPPATDSIQHFCKEYEAGQYEIGTVPASPLAAADRMVLVRELLKTAAQSSGWGINLQPQPYNVSSGNAFQISVVVPTLCDGTKPTETLRACARLIAQRVTEDTLAFCPSASSYARLRNQEFASVNDWGEDRRDCLVRLVESGNVVRIEVRLADPSANVHLCTHLVLSTILSFLEELEQPNTKLKPEPAVLPMSLSDSARRFLSGSPRSLTPDQRKAIVAVLQHEQKQEDDYHP